jgi:hypothetical protein
MSTLLSSCAEGKKRKTFFEIDKEFESMKTVVKSNFVTVDSFTSSMRASLRQARVHNNAKTTVPKAVITCTVCKSNGHNAHGCWFNAENKLKEAAKMKSDAEDILKSKKSNKKTLVAG